MKLHNPLPQSIEEDINKCAHILEKFTKKELSSSKASVLEKVIPPDVIANCKGVAVMTVLKAGFIWSGRTGTGLVVAKLEDGSWSAPSAIGTIGAGVGGQIGAELTDFVIILNTRQAVEAFSMGGNVTLGGNLSVAAGPFGRSAEAGGAVGKMAPIFSYSKTKGLFAGISIEGSVIVERKDANHRFYGQRFTPKEILSGKVPAPASANALYKALDKQSHLTTGGLELNSATSATSAHSASAYSASAHSANSAYTNSSDSVKPAMLPRPSLTSSTLPPYAAESASAFSKVPVEKQKSLYESLSRQPSNLQINPSTQSQPPALYSAASTSSSTSSAPKRPPPPILPKRFVRAIALYDFDGERETDLSFKKGDEITVTKKTLSTDDWWTGSLRGSSGDFPANYVNLIQ